MSSNALKEPNEHKDGPVRNATFFASEYLLGAFALAIGFSLSVTVDKEILSLPKESLLELAIFVVTAFVVIGLYWISSALSFLGETQRNVLKVELDETTALLRGWSASNAPSGHSWVAGSSPATTARD
jgi:hypothetical protein